MHTNRLLACAALLAACAKTPPPKDPGPLVRAEPVFGPSREADLAEAFAISQARKTTPIPPRATRRGHRGESSREPATGEEAIRDANARALRVAEEEGFDGATLRYLYEPGAVFEIIAAPGRLTDIALEPGEVLTAPPAAGDVESWGLGVSDSAGPEGVQKHVVLSPIEAGQATDLIVYTDRRVYRFAVRSIENEGDGYLVSVSWEYPGAGNAPAGSGGAFGVGLASAPLPRPRTDSRDMNCDYTIKVTDGAPPWKPNAVCDDGGHKTWIYFPKRVLSGEAPVLFALGTSGKKQVTNYRVRGATLEVDQLFNAAELRLGEKDQDVVRIERKRPGR